MNKFTNYLVIVLCIFSVFINAFLAGFINGLLDKNTRMAIELAYYHDIYLHKQGATSLWAPSHGQMINYDLRSFDGGKNWYAVDESGASVTIIGDVNTVYPGLMKNLQEWDEIMDRVYHERTNGTLNYTSPEFNQYWKIVTTNYETE